jgi:putative lipoic acid-binding regulatory protein
VFEERILDSRVEFSLRELLGIAKKEFHDLLVDLVKRKRQNTEESAPRVNLKTVLMSDT